MNHLDDRELVRCLNTRSVRTDELVLGDIVTDDFGCWMVGVLREYEPGKWEVLDYLNCGGVGYRAEDTFDIIPKSSLLPEAVEWLLGFQQREAERMLNPC